LKILFGSKEKLQVSRVLALLGCIVFTASIFYPFLQIKWIDTSWGWNIRMHSLNFWSFQEADIPENAYSHLAFADYWTYWQALVGGPPLFLSFGRITYYMFATQLLTIAAGFVTIFKQKRYTIALPTLFAATTLVLMILAENAASDLVGQKTLQSGFWLTAISFSLFLTTLSSLCVWNKTLPQPTNQPKLRLPDSF
jgi:hypothetical protein